MTRRFKTNSLADQVYEQLENDIIQGVYPKGTMLTELKLVERLGVSRTPIREALRHLERERLIEDTGKGSMVLGISMEDMEDIMIIRERVEGIAAYHAAQNITAEEREAMDHLMQLQEFYFQQKDADRLRQIDDQFHESICTMSKRTVITDTLIPLTRKTRRYRRLSMDDWDWVAMARRDHEKIYQAIVAGDAEGARQATEEHIRDTWIHMRDIVLSREEAEV